MKEKKLNILQAISGQAWSGGQQQTLHLLTGLKKRGHNVFLACPHDAVLARKAEESGITVCKIAMRREADFSSMWKLYKLMKKERIDVVNAQRPAAHTLALIAAVFAGVPAFVATRRVSVKLSGYVSAKLKYSMADKIISVSDGVKDVLVECGVKESMIKTVYSGIELERFNPAIDGSHIRAEFNIPHDAPLIGMVGNVGEEKGQLEFVKAAKIVLKEIPEARFMLVGRDAEISFVENIDKNLAPYFVCAGFRKDVPEILAAIDVHVNSSIGFDGLAGTIREGLAMKKPTVATDVAGHSEIVKDMETGLLVPPHDEEMLASAIIKLVKEKELALKLGENGRVFVEENLTDSAMVQKTESVYMDVLMSKGLFK